MNIKKKNEGKYVWVVMFGKIKYQKWDFHGLNENSEKIREMSLLMKCNENRIKSRDELINV